jgi:heptosyltransferase-3
MFSGNDKMLVPSVISRFTSNVPGKAVEEIRQKPGKILLVKQAERLGNIVLLNTAISALKREFPDSEIDLLLPAKFSDIMLDDRRINSIIPIYKRIYISRPWRLLRLLKKLRANRYDIAIDCSDVNSHSSTGAAYTLLSGARVFAGWQSGGFFDLNVPRYGDIIHASEMYLRLISGIFGNDLKGEPYFQGSSENHLSEKPLIGINCGGRDDKKWPLEKFIRLGEMLSEKNITAEFILGPDEEDLRETLLENLSSGCKLLPLIPVSDLKHTFRKYSVFVTSDSGPMHVAWSLNIPVVAIFLSSEIEKFRPLSEGSVVVDGNVDLEPSKVLDLILNVIDSRRIAV